MAFTQKEAPNCPRCPFRADCFYELIDAKAQKEWIKMRVAHTFRKGDVVFFEGQRPPGLYVVCTGRVKIFKTSRGGQQLLSRIEQAGDLLGHRALLANENYASTAEAMDQSTISLVDEKRFEKFLLENPRAAMALLRAMAKDIRAGEDKARDIAYKSARARMAGILLKFAEKAKRGKPSVRGLRRKDLAEMSGLTIETTVRTLQAFEKKGYVRRKEKEIEILDEDKLQLIVGSGT